MQELCNLLIDNGYRLVKVIEPNMSEKRIDGRNIEFVETASGSVSGSDPFRDAPCDDFQAVASFEAGSSEVIQEDPILVKEMQQARRRAELIKLEKEVDNPKLVTALRKWRRAKAQLQNVPAFYVLANKTLLMIALAAPSTMEELLSVKGFGPVLAEKYGQELLDLIAGVMEVGEVDSPLIE